MTHKNAVAISVSDRCNNSCCFCFVGQDDLKRKRLQPKSFCQGDEIKQILRSYQSRCDEVIFAGREPTLNDSLPDVIRYAKSLGFQVSLQTNGRMLAYRDYCKQIADIGTDNFIISLLSATPSIHDSLTRSPGSFQQTISGIMNLASLGVADKVSICSVVTRENVSSLPALVPFLRSFDVKCMKLNAVYSYDRRIVPRFSLVKKYLRRVFDQADKYRVRAYLFGFPLCVLEKFWLNASEIHPAGKLIAGCRINDMSYIRKVIGRNKPATCLPCPRYASCEGAWKPYYELYGYSELSPRTAWT